MDKEQFWQIIDEARAKVDRWQHMYEPLCDALMELDAPEIIHWQQIFDEYQMLSYKEKMWATAAVILGGCSDDGFDYFRGWLTAQGKEVFMNALSNPESLADNKAVKAFGRETIAQYYTPIKGYYEAMRFEKILSVAAEAYERKTGGDLYDVIDDTPLSEREKAEIADSIDYAEDIDAEWEGLDEEWTETETVLEAMFPKLHALFNKNNNHKIGAVTFSIVDKVCANTPDGRHMLIIQAYNENNKETVWAIGDDQVCAITRADCIRNNIPYNSVLIKEFPYANHTPLSVKKWRPLIEALVDITAESYLKHNGMFHIYPQWLPEEAYAHLGKELFGQMAEGCDHIVLRDNGGGGIRMMDFIPKKAKEVKHRKPVEKESVIDKIRQGQQQPSEQQSKPKKRSNNEPEH